MSEQPIMIFPPRIEQERMELPNETKIKFCNAWSKLNAHAVHIYCCECKTYLYSGDGDLCDKGKAILANGLAYADTTPIFEP